MNVFFKKRLIVIESNVTWALPYWRERQRLNPDISWTFR